MRWSHALGSAASPSFRKAGPVGADQLRLHRVEVRVRHERGGLVQDPQRPGRRGATVTPGLAKPGPTAVTACTLSVAATPLVSPVTSSCGPAERTCRPLGWTVTRYPLTGWPPSSWGPSSAAAHDRRRLAGTCCRDDAEHGSGTGPDPVAGGDAHVVRRVVGEAGQQGAGARDVDGWPIGEDLDDEAGDRVPIGRRRYRGQPDGAVPEVRRDSRCRRWAGGDDLRGAGRTSAHVVDGGAVESGDLAVGEPADGQDRWS